MKMKAIAGWSAKKQRDRREENFLFPFSRPDFIFTYPDHVCCVQNVKTANSTLRILPLSSLKNRSRSISRSDTKDD